MHADACKLQWDARVARRAVHDGKTFADYEADDYFRSALKVVGFCQTARRMNLKVSTDFAQLAEHDQQLIRLRLRPNAISRTIRIPISLKL